MIRRAPLAARTPLRHRTPMPPRVAGLNPRRRRHVATNTPVERTTSAAWAALRQQLWERTGGGYCEACGKKLNPLWWDANHRKLAGQGGLDELPNLVALHPSCHTLHAGAVHEETGAAYDRGLLVRFAVDPRTAPLHLPDGHWVLLTYDGQYEEVAA
jgi:hypothetical protein